MFSTTFFSSGFASRQRDVDLQYALPHGTGEADEENVQRDPLPGHPGHDRISRAHHDRRAQRQSAALPDLLHSAVPLHGLLQSFVHTGEFGLNLDSKL